jgi:phosphatidylglycerophosphate synthase
MDDRTVSGPLAQLPNALTVARLLLIPVYVVLILVTHHGAQGPLWIFWVGVALALAALADYAVRVRREVLA